MRWCVLQNIAPNRTFFSYFSSLGDWVINWVFGSKESEVRKYGGGFQGVRVTKETCTRSGL